MKGLKIFVAAAAASVLAAVVSCDDGAPFEPPQHDQTASVRIEAVHAGGGQPDGGGQSDGSMTRSGQPNGPMTRADAAPIPSGTPLELKPGHIFFIGTPAGGTGNVIMHHFGLDTSAGSRRVTRAALLGGGLVLDEILVEAPLCVIVSGDAAARINGQNGITGNWEGRSVDDLGALTVAATALNTASGDVSTVPLIGAGTVTQRTGTVTGGTYQMAVTVPLEAMASRIQIKKITGVDYTDPDDPTHTVSIDDFTVEAIFINNFYPSISVLGTYPQPIVNSGSDTDMYSATTGAPYNATGLGFRLADLPVDGGEAVNGSATPVRGSWAYNVVPTPESTPEAVPHIVVRFSEVTYTDSRTGSPTTLDDRYLTLGEIRFSARSTTGTSGTVVSSFAPGNIYTFDEIRFDYSDLGRTPETDGDDGALYVEVNATIFYWRSNFIGTDI